MIRNKIKMMTLAACAALTLFSTTAFAGNKDFSFSLTSTASKESSLGAAKKSNDGDTNAYVTPNASKSNLAIKGATVNFRVRDNAGNYATEYVECHAYKRYIMKYLPGKAVGGASYRLYANVEKTNAYPVILGGLWCP
ncbi:MAG: hypothetical protein HDR22_01995 [Lachnospiraceae bacterium]|nr:hypothetical protein [Lachnospiraceae bacterium]